MYEWILKTDKVIYNSFIFWQLLGGPVLEYLGEIMGDDFTKEKTADAWVGLLKVIVAIVDDEAANLWKRIFKEI